MVVVGRCCAEPVESVKFWFRTDATIREGAMPTTGKPKKVYRCDAVGCSKPASGPGAMCRECRDSVEMFRMAWRDLNRGPDPNAEPLPRVRRLLIEG